MIKAAQDYISEGFAAVPLYTDKSPMVEQGANYLYQIYKDDEIDRMFLRAEKIGISCGPVSGGFYAIDFDCHKGENIQSIFTAFVNNEFVKTIIDTYDLPIFKTMSGGYHIYFKCEEDVISGHALSKWESGDVMIEIRGKGQYIALFPSKGYKRLSGSEIIKVAKISKEEKDTLLAVAQSFNKYIRIEEEGKGSGKWPEKWDVSKPIGRYNETESNHAKDILNETGWVLVRTRIDGVEMWLRPGKEQTNGTSGHSATYGARHNMFYVYSSSAEPFTDWKAYSNFDILKLLKFNNDFREALTFLEDRYREKFEEVEPPTDETPIIKNDIPHFPLDVFPEDLARYITELNQALNYSIDFLALASMFAIAVCNGNRTKLQVKNGWIAPSIFWFAIVGEPGTMKSHPVNMMINPINKLDRDSKRIYDEMMRVYNKQEKENKGRKPTFKQMLISDYTLEALHCVHDINKRGVGLYKDELIGFLNDMNKYRKGSDEQFWLESFNNKSYIVNRVTKEPVFIEDININIIGTIQPKTLNSVVMEFAGNGLVDRFLYTRAESIIYPMSRLDVSKEWVDWWEKMVRNASEYLHYLDKDDVHILKMNSEAMDLLYNYDAMLVEMQTDTGITLNMKGYLNKMKTYLPRFALLMGLFDLLFNGYLDTIEARHMEGAWKLTQYFIESAKSVFNEAEETMEISQVTRSMFGMTKKEKTIQLYKKGFRQHEICKELNSPREVVSRIISQHKSTEVNK